MIGTSLEVLTAAREKTRQKSFSSVDRVCVCVRRSIGSGGEKWELMSAASERATDAVLLLILSVRQHSPSRGSEELSVPKQIYIFHSPGDVSLTLKWVSNERKTGGILSFSLHPSLLI
jgi:hypothetical protein